MQWKSWETQCQLEDGVLLLAKRRARTTKKEGEAVSDWNRWNSEPEDSWVYLANLMEAVRFLQPWWNAKNPDITWHHQQAESGRSREPRRSDGGDQNMKEEIWDILGTQQALVSGEELLPGFLLRWRSICFDKPADYVAELSAGERKHRRIHKQVFMCLCKNMKWSGSVQRR